MLTAVSETVQSIASQYGIPVIEDAAQAIGSRFDGRCSGSWGIVGCFSPHPLKNLNACGDAGFITTNDQNVAHRIRLMRNHGLVGRDSVKTFGFVSRMDEIQAAILRHRLLALPTVIQRRQANVALYRSILNSTVAFHPPDRSTEFNSWHTFVIQVEKRDQLRKFLSSKNIETVIHYPVPTHLQPASLRLGYKVGDFPIAEAQAEKIITLPIHQYLQEDQIRVVAEAVNGFFNV